MRQAPFTSLSVLSIFQSTHPSGVRPNCCWTLRIARRRFQSTHPSGVRPCRPSRQPGRSGHFNPRTPVGCDCHCCVLLVVVFISIHAPQWGATRQHRISTCITNHFNPRTPVGCDSMETAFFAIDRYFNPRTPVGCDRRLLRPRPPQTYFNPRTPVGCDPCALIHLTAISYFNPRTPVGCDRCPPATSARTLFQSTHPSGVRPAKIVADVVLRISIHAPQWGATERDLVLRVGQFISIHAPQWGATTISL